MLTAFLEFIEQRFGEKSEPPARELRDSVRLAVAALCVEMARADTEERPAELERASVLLAQRFALSTADAQQLLMSGEVESDRAVSLYGFIRVLNDQLGMPEKIALLEMLWRVAYGDGTLDKYEDALMHKIAELLYVPLADLMLARERVLAEK
ncbi:MAG: TerB family tellurite resistance protein [Gammaproteobacteria bacterium]|nr:TerB family tellurite resistance protein [Gammaproteobacteria bacterium]